ncbi:helix-turn-helix domain-containing protein [Shewanella insulae]|uniref:helix-turn-helix domain-containing protein n=1 Tax=Shewanella insulae TaxID=2681496 RepID=UPI003CE45753
MDRIDTMKALTAVVQEGSFTKAADKLGLSSQLVSKYVSQLEEHLKVRLLNRTTRRVCLRSAPLCLSAFIICPAPWCSFNSNTRMSGWISL